MYRSRQKDVSWESRPISGYTTPLVILKHHNLWKI